MIQLPSQELPVAAGKQLERWQTQIDELETYADRVEQAKKKFGERNKPTNPTFKQVRNTLGKMCSGARRCAYCEDSAADEVEHIRPKNLYPEAVFRWDNYLYACGPCNGPKNDKFKVFSELDGTVVDVTRPLGSPVVEPHRGEPLLIDPRREDPLDFMEIDLMGTFWFWPKADKGTPEYERAEYTIDVLRLNERELLPQAREEVYRSYVARLKEYIVERNGGASKAQLAQFVRALQNMQHPTVWREIQRQHTQHPNLQRLFERAPEALDW